MKNYILSQLFEHFPAVAVGELFISKDPLNIQINGSQIWFD